jgi:hydrogenase nickel incorporation protein HypA/HybF
MHELSLMGDILDMVQKDASGRGLKQVSKVNLLVGVYSNALPDALQMAFLMFLADKSTILADGAELGIEIEEAKARCVLCGLEYVPDQAVAVCPDCRFPSGQLTAGEAFRVLSYEGS